MNLLDILILTLACLLLGWIGRNQWRVYLLLTSSILAIYWLQPSTPIRHLDFWLPTGTIILAVLVWASTRSSQAQPLRTNLATATVIILTILIVGLLRYIPPICCLTPSHPPGIVLILFVLTLVIVSVVVIARTLPGNAWLLNLLVWIILGVFILLKTEFFAYFTSLGLRSLTGQSVDLASALDLRWLGFSYVAFRLIHTLRDRIAGRLPDYSLAEYIVFIIFFPAYIAGPIDRLQRFAQDLRKPFRLDAVTLTHGSQRIMIGIFLKFVLADSLTIIALNDVKSAQVSSSAWLWILLYAYTFRIYFDFSGYTDIAIGMGTLMGIQLPENFSRPYRKPNLTLFWNSWHMSLAQWFRAYYFNPLTRSLRTSKVHLPASLIIMISQISTMLLIGLWHGITWNFAIWGLWHGIGLFIHNRWSDFIRPHIGIYENNPWIMRGLQISGTILTFNYVALSWVWFALESTASSWQVLLSLFGLGGSH